MPANASHEPPTVVVIPAFNEEARIAATVVAAKGIPSVIQVIVVDDGSADQTADTASQVGAVVVPLATNAGKAAAMERGADAAIEARGNTDEWNLLFLDADLEGTASAAVTLLPPLWNRSADMTIATLPSISNAGGGRGFVVRLARDGIKQATGWQPTQPLSGQRAITPRAFQAALPLARGFGVEVGLTIDLLRQGYHVQEVPVDLRHRVTGTDWRAQAHRARQFWAVWRALRSRGVGPALPLPR